MSNVDLETRVANLEVIVAQLRQKIETEERNKLPWWKQISETFADDGAYEEAMRLGREYRESLRPKDDEEQ
jgi:hypothetical protein